MHGAKEVVAHSADAQVVWYLLELIHQNCLVPLIQHIERSLHVVIGFIISV